jgi:gluconate 5-dehydrogenase
MMKFDKFDLTGKVALCAGGSSGLGLQFAKAMASAGADVAIVARRVDRLEENKKVIEEEYGVKCYTHYMDLCKPETITACVEDVLAHFGKIDILVNSAGVPCRNVAETQSYEDWMLVMNSDLNGPFWLMHECVRLAMKPQMYGKIVNIASIHAFVSRIGYNTNAYCAAKGGLLMLTKSLANEWAKYNITVNGIAPGYFPSELTQRYVDSPEFKQTCEVYSPFGRPGITGEMDGLCIYLASDASSFTTGQTVAVDGGWLTV